MKSFRELSHCLSKSLQVRSQGPQKIATWSPIPKTVNGRLKMLDRRQLEQERLSRQAARKRQLDASTSPSPTQDGGRHPKRARASVEVIDLVSPTRPSSNMTPTAPLQAGSSMFTHPSSQQPGNPMQAFPSIPNYATQTTRQVHTNRPSSQKPMAPQYLNGAIKRTWAQGYPRENDIKIEEVLQKDDLNSVVLSTWQFETEWWMDKIDCWKTKQVWIIGAKDQATHDSFAGGPAMIPNLSICFPDMNGVAKLNHAKFFILSYPNYLRIVVTTANLTSYDWGESGDMENSVFLIDLPRLPDGQVLAEEDLTFFGKEILYYLRYIKLRENLAKSILKFDFSRTKHLAFVHSLAGAHTGEEMQRTGFPGLSRAVRQLNLQTQMLEVDYATSSIGALSRAFMRQMITAAQGGETQKPKNKYDGDVPVDDLLKRFRVFFPTANTVKASRGGTNAAGTICAQKKWYDAPGFPKPSMRDHKSTRRGLLSHSKILLARGQRVAGGEGGEGRQHTNVGWGYVGSANLTQSAWGDVTTDRVKKTPKVSCRNYECGVLVAVPSDGINKDVKPGEVPGFDAFRGVLDVPFETPGEPYGVKVPWFYSSVP